MNFTREPTIESVISSREGYKLSIRNSKKESKSEYQQLDSIEVVSFGNQVFFRCIDRPKSFILPVSDYEVVEVRETRLLIKNPTVERNVKISIEDEPTNSLSKDDDKKEASQKKKRRNRTKKTVPTSKTEVVEKETQQANDKTLKEGEELTKNLFKDLLTPPQMLISQALTQEDATNLPQESSTKVTLPELQEKFSETSAKDMTKPEKKKIIRKKISPPLRLVEFSDDTNESKEKKIPKKVAKKKATSESKDKDLVAGKITE